jgi:hypothetical protein
MEAGAFNDAELAVYDRKKEEVMNAFDRQKGGR